MLFTHVLAPNCIATLLDFYSTGMPVSVLCRDHEYTATYSSIVNLQMRRRKTGMQKKKKKMIEKKKANLNVGLQMCMTFKSSMKSHCSPACDNLHILYVCKRYSAHVGDFGNLIHELIIIMYVNDVREC